MWNLAQYSPSWKGDSFPIPTPYSRRLRRLHSQRQQHRSLNDQLNSVKQIQRRRSAHFNDAACVVKWRHNVSLAARIRRWCVAADADKESVAKTRDLQQRITLGRRSIRARRQSTLRRTTWRQSQARCVQLAAAFCFSLSVPHSFLSRRLLI